MRRAIASLIVFLVATLAALATTPATADYLSIDFNGLKLAFAGGQIYDADHLAGGNGSANDATALTSIVFTKNSTGVASLTSSVSADIRIEGVPNVPVNDYVDFTPTSEGFIDLFDGGTPLLHLPVTLASASYDDFFGFELSAFASDGIIQNLPSNLMFNLDEPISVRLIGLTFESTSIAGDYMTGFVRSSGYGESLGTLVPEPSSLILLLGLAASALAAYARRQHRS